MELLSAHRKKRLYYQCSNTLVQLTIRYIISNNNERFEYNNIIIINYNKSNMSTIILCSVHQMMSICLNNLFLFCYDKFVLFKIGQHAFVVNDSNYCLPSDVTQCKQ